MPFILKQIKTRPNQEVSFHFDAPVISYMVGLNSFRLSFPESGGDHWLKDVRLNLIFRNPTRLPPSLQPDGRPGPVTADQETRQLNVMVLAYMSDNSGHTLSNEESEVTVACLAFVAGPLEPTLGIQREVVRNQFQAPLPEKVQDEHVGGLAKSLFALSGFHLSFGLVDRQVTRIKVRVNELGPDCEMYGWYRNIILEEEYGYEAAELLNADISYGAFYHNMKDHGLGWHEWKHVFPLGNRWGSGQFIVPFPWRGAQTISMLHGFDLTYGEGALHNVLRIEASAGVCGVTPEGNVTVTDAYARMMDASGNYAESFCEYWVFATPGGDFDWNWPIDRQSEELV